MKQSEKELFSRYIQTQLDEKKHEVDKLTQLLRYRHTDVNDCFELALAKERLACFEEFARDSMVLLRINNWSGKK